MTNLFFPSDLPERQFSIHLWNLYAIYNKILKMSQEGQEQNKAAHLNRQPTTQENMSLYQEYVRLLQTSYQLCKKRDQFMRILKDISAKTDSLEVAIDKMQKNMKKSLNINFTQENSSMNSQKIRRKNNMIDKKIQCKVQGCRKAFSSENALSQHTKLKHSKSSSPTQFLDSQQMYSLFEIS